MVSKTKMRITEKIVLKVSEIMGNKNTYECLSPLETP